MNRGADSEDLTETLRCIGAGDRAALRRLYEATQAKLFGICLRILNDRAEAEDILQSVYITVWQRAGSYDSARARPITWLATIARNRAIDRVRMRPARAHAEIDAAADVADPAPLASELIEAAEVSGRIGGCIDELGERQAAAIRGAFFAGLTYDALAAGEGIPLGTMKSWIRRSLTRLRECLER